jgi:poly-gamma-glutamate synthesis protein (capsule biosynthesis protein)
MVRRRWSPYAWLGSLALLAGCSTHGWSLGEDDERRPGVVTLAFAGDVHFEGDLRDVPRQDDSTLGRMSQVLAGADLAVVNLETAVTRRGEPARKELEDRRNRYWFRAPASALDVLERSGVDVASMANNHGADYGVRGVRDSVAAARDATVDLVGLGLGLEAAYAPHRSTVRGTSVAVHAADASPLESEADVWTAEPGSGPGLATARGEGTERLLASVRSSAERDDVVVVYLHWGAEGLAEPTRAQERLAAQLADAGADVVVGAHTHVPMGAGMLDDTYVAYGLGNFHWYHGDTAESGVLQVELTDGEVTDDRWVPGRIPPDGGGPVPVDGAAQEEAVASWRSLRDSTTLAAPPGAAGAEPPPELPAFEATIDGIDAGTRARMTSHDPETCPVPLSDLRLLRLSYVGFDGRAHQGEMVVNADVARDVVQVFGALYRERFPLQSMRLVDEFDGDDDRSMAANNTSGYNCRRVAGSDSWSAHAYGRAVDVNPVQNPYVVDGRARPAGAQAFVDVDRSPGADAAPGVVVEDGVVDEAFTRIGWDWGADFPEPDWQHYATR